MSKDASLTNANGGLRPGHLQFASLASAKKAVEKIPVQDTGSKALEFDLGDAKSSIQRFFVLKNTGDVDIRNIHLTTNNPHFYFSPSTIKVLQPAKNAPILQVITLNVVHGNRLDGLGPDSLLPMGDNAAEANISGNTTDAQGDTLNLSQEVSFNVFAKVLDFKLYRSDAVEVDMSQYGLDFGRMKAFTSEPVRDWNMGGDTIRMLNTGNTPFTLHIWHLANNVLVPFDSAEIESGESYRLERGYVEVDGEGVIANPSKVYLQPAKNGRIYMAICDGSFNDEGQACSED